MNLLEELQNTVAKAKTPEQAQKLLVDYLSSLDFSNEEMKRSGFSLVSHFLERVQKGEQLNLLETKAIVTTMFKIVMEDYGLKDIKIHFRDKTPEEKFVAAFYRDHDKSVTFFNDSQEFKDFMSGNLDLNTRLNILSNDIFRVVAHELRHAVQFRRLESNSIRPEDVNTRNFLMSKQFLSQQFSEIAPKYKRTNINKQLYSLNHDKFIYEIDANAAAHSETIYLLEELSPTLFEKQINQQRRYRDERLDKLKNSENIEWKHDTNPNNDVVNANHKASLVIDTVLPQLNSKDRKFLFEKNPILHMTYNPDGSKKSLEQVEREREANINRILVTGTPEDVKKQVPRIIRTYETAIESDPVLSFERCMKQIATLSWDGARYYSRGGENLEEKWDHAKVIAELNAAVKKAEKLASYIEEVDYKIVKQAFAKCKKDLEISKKTDQRSWMFYNEKRRAMYGIEREIMLNRDFRIIKERDRKEAAKKRMNEMQAKETIKKVFPNFNPQNIRFEGIANSSVLKEANNVEEKLLLMESLKQYMQDSAKYRQTKHKTPVVSQQDLYMAIRSFYNFEATDEQKQEFERKLKNGEIELLKNVYTEDGYLERKQELLPHATKKIESVTKEEIKQVKEQPLPAPKQEPQTTRQEEKEEFDEYGIKIPPKENGMKSANEIPLRNAQRQQNFERTM